MTEPLWIILGDVVASTRIRDREEFRARIERACSEANRRYREGIHAGLKVLKGIDEIGGALSHPRHAYLAVDTIAEHLYPVTIRFVIVRDLVDTARESRDVAKMDGPAFHRGAELMRGLKQSGLRLAFWSGHELIDAAVAGEVNLLLILKASWTAKQREVIQAYKSTGSQAEAAKTLGITQQAVSKALSRSSWREIAVIEGKLNDALASYPE